MHINDLLLGYSFDDERRFFDDMSGWVKFQPVLAEITDPDEIRRRLKYELDYNKRAIMIERLIQKYNKLRSKEVERIMYDYLHPKS